MARLNIYIAYAGCVTARRLGSVHKSYAYEERVSVSVKSMVLGAIVGFSLSLVMRRFSFLNRVDVPKKTKFLV